MARRKRNKVVKRRKTTWQTKVWYILGALIVLSMVFALVASAFTSGGAF